MNSQGIAAVLATLIGLAVAAYALANVSLGDTYAPAGQAVKTAIPKDPVVQEPAVKGPVVRELPAAESK
jgi:hypothetical protein